MLDLYKKRVKDVEGMKAEIVRFHNSTVTTDDKTTANRWYYVANAICKDLAAMPECQERFSLSQVAGVVSALSPACSWETNVADAETLIKGFCAGIDFDAITVSTYGQNKAKAFRILSGPTPLVNVREQFTAGTKTDNFLINIAKPSFADAVTIDRHAIGIALGSTDTSHQRLSITANRYRKIADAYRAAALHLGYKTANALQAVTWVAFRRDHSGR